MLRSGPRGFQSPRAGRHWKEAIPAGTDRQEQRKGPQGKRRGAKAGGKEMTEGDKWERKKVRGTWKTRHEVGQIVKRGVTLR